MRLIGLAGWSGAGKTTLIRALIPVLRARGLSVSTIKQAHHGFEIDRPGKDSWVHREAGAQDVLVASPLRWALIHELRDAPSLTLPELVARLSPVDLVLVEGFKRETHPKIEVRRDALAKPLLYPDDPHIVAIASDTTLPDAPVPVIPLDDIDTLATHATTHAVPPDAVAWAGFRHTAG